MKPTHPALIVAAAAMTLTVTLTGCSDKGSTTTGSETTAAAGASNADASALLTSAAEASKKVSSLHFVVDVAGKVPNMPISKVDGALQLKPATAAQGTATIDIGGKSEGKFTFIDGHMYASILGDKYADYGDGKAIYDVSALFDQSTGIPNILTKVAGAKAEGTETINGQETTRITGTVPATEIAAISGSRVAPEKSVPVPTTLWIQSSGDKQLARIKVTPSTEGSITLTFSKWGEKVTVTKPDVPAVEIGTPTGDGATRPKK